MKITSMEKLSNGIIKVGLGANEDAKTELFVDLYGYTCSRADIDNEEFGGTFVAIYDVKNKNRIMLHYRDDYDVWHGGSLAFMAGNGEEFEIRHDYPIYKLISTVFAALDSKKTPKEICSDPESIFNNHPGEKIQHKPLDHTSKQVDAIKEIVNSMTIKEIINSMPQKTRE